MSNSKTEATFHHPWPQNGECVFDKWTAHTAQGIGKPALQSRRCVHPDCKNYEVREAPKS